MQNENIHYAAHLKHVPGLRARNAAMLQNLAAMIKRGQREKRFRAGIDALDLHTNITALCFYTVSNRYSFREGFARDMWAADELKKRRQQIVEIICGWCAA